jgi:signal transduction histidine kinase
MSNMESTANTDAICLQVFTRMSAAVSHEIKNALSIINENAGLLDDLSAFAGPDGGICARRVRVTVASIMKQVVRSDTIMKNLNRFAHSADTPLTQASLEETLALVVALTSRQAAMKSITVQVDCPSNPAMYTYLLHFEALLFLTLCRIYRAIAEGSSLVVATTVDLSRIIIRCAVADQQRKLLETYPDNEELALLEKLGGIGCSEDGFVTITLPAKLAVTGE